MLNCSLISIHSFFLPHTHIHTEGFFKIESSWWGNVGFGRGILVFYRDERMTDMKEWGWVSGKRGVTWAEVPTVEGGGTHGVRSHPLLLAALISILFPLFTWPALMSNFTVTENIFYSTFIYPILKGSNIESHFVNIQCSNPLTCITSGTGTKICSSHILLE